MAKLSSNFMFLLTINIIGFILMSAIVDEGLATDNNYAQENSLLEKFMTPKTVLDTDGVNRSTYVLDNSSNMFIAIPQQPPESFIENFGQFIDRIFIMFDFVRIMLGVLLFPILLMSFMGLPWQLSLMFFPPLIAMYMFGFMDLFSGGDN